jgi:pimeloyl-ACP methyl ester carboxylesterase
MRQMYARITPEMRQMVLRLYRAASPAEFADWEPRMLAATDACPTLAVWGSDPYVPGWVAMRIGAQQERHWGACGHWLPTEAPERVAGEVIRWLGDPDEVASEREAHPPSPTIDE